MKVAVIDDLLECRIEIQNCLHRYFAEHYANEVLSIENFSSGEAFLSSFKKDTYELIFIDQYMEKLTGIETALEIREIDELVTLIFITTSRDHAIDGYKVRAGGYLLKPFAYIEFENTLSLLSIAKLRSARFIRVEDEQILLREILWCDLDGHYIQIHTEQRNILRFRISFGNLSSMLFNYPQFLTCYKGCIVNLDHVERLDEMDFILTTGEKIPFSKRNKKNIETDYHTYLFQKAREEELL